ncbi:hypothetical protein FM106_01015 [Brachybacterium faecium]|nr:hypothetical protein FM106_01015 [Brachybacterium faecium]
MKIQKNKGLYHLEQSHVWLFFILSNHYIEVCSYRKTHRFVCYLSNQPLN